MCQQSRYLLIIIAFLLLFCQWPGLANPPENKPPKSIEVDIYWYATEPFIYKNKQGEIKGIEYDLMESFLMQYQSDSGIQIIRNWIELKDFGSVFDKVSHSTNPNTFAVSAISYSTAREEVIAFTPPYMPDVNVLLVSHDIPEFKDKRELKRYLEEGKVFTIENTTYEADWIQLSNEFEVSPTYIFVGNDMEIIDALEVNKISMGYCGLPFYIKALDKGTNVKRQNFYQQNREGFRFILAPKSPWVDITEQYFNTDEFKSYANQIIKTYLGDANYELIWEISESISKEDSELVFLRKEREIQDQRLINAQLREERQHLIIISAMAFLVFLFGFLLNLLKINRKKSQINTLLRDKRRELEELLEKLQKQNTRIEEQNKLIEQKNSMLRNRNRDLKDLNEQKQELIGVVSHDLKSPINQITGLVGIFNATIKGLSDEEQEIVSRIENSARRLKEMVERILDIEALNSKQINLNKREVNVSELLLTLLQNFNPIAEKKNIRLSTDQIEEGLFCTIDEGYSIQVFENLISNALKFSPPNTQVCVIASKQDDNVRISIKDQGPGISDSDKQKLFGKFQRLSAKPTGDEKSTGLGLSIVKKYVNAMDGEVWCESEYGKGATFIVEFERAK